MTDADLAAIHGAAMSVPTPWSAAEIAQIRRMPGSVEVIWPEGFALGRVTLDEAELLTIAVDPLAQGCGIGRDVLGRFHDLASGRGAGAVFLEVAETNVRARRLYDLAGYQGVGRRKAYYSGVHGGIDAIVMRRGLLDDSGVAPP